MPAYVIFTREEPVRDQDEMAEYQRLNRETPPIVPMKPLVVYGETVGLEGKVPDGVIVVEFATIDDAKAWYDSPDYQNALSHRMKAAEYRGFIVQGL